ncbi:arylsulfotransferase family protein [Oscillibacter sp.]|uniref:arylsulfotransferase family protein n=1 Tax=Oscillibacter sp. TaxID=1945593 RepID=UPI0028A290A2|nr:aryl-sulfate sulfotransferase [Oscillibacter sp.]
MKKNRLSVGFVFAVLLSLALAGCGATSAGTASQTSATAELTIGKVPISIDLNASDVWYETGWLTTEFAVDCMADNCPGREIYLNGNLVTAETPIQLKLEVMNPSTGIEVKVVDTASRDEVVNYVRTVPKALTLQIEGSPEEDGYYYFNMNNYLCKMDGSGNFAYYAYNPCAVDFKPALIDGTVYYTYCQQDNVEDGWDAGNLKASVHVMNEWYGEIDSISCLLTDEGMPESQFLNNHEFTMLGENHYIITSYVVKRATNIPEDVEGSSPFGNRVLAGVFQEIKDGQVLFQWDSTEHPELYGMSVDGNDYLGAETYYADYVHLNSVEIDPADGNYIISLRNTATIVKISKETGDILWILGGKGDQFGLTSAQKTSAQHFARSSSRGTITVFDNGLILPDGTPNPLADDYTTRVVEYKIDEKNKKLISFAEYLAPGACSPIMGSAELLDEETDTFLIGWGGKRAGTPIFTETNFKEKKHTLEVWNRDGGVISGGSYRVYKSSF